MALPAEKERYTFADCLTWGEDERIEIIDGEAPEDIDTMVEPDISIVFDSPKLDKHGCKDPPDRVVEILSPST